MDETWHFFKDVLLLFIVPWCIWVTMQIFGQKEKIALGRQSLETLRESISNNADEMRILDGEVKSELKEMNKKIDDMPSKIVQLLQNLK